MSWFESIFLFLLMSQFESKFWKTFWVASWFEAKLFLSRFLTFLTHAREWGPELRALEGGQNPPPPCQLSSYES